MKAKDRCKEYLNGDKCRRPLDHTEEVHLGQFSGWTGSGDSKIKVAAITVVKHRRNRSLNRFFKATCTKDFNPKLVPEANRQKFKHFLDMAAKHYKGIQQ